MKPDKQLEKKCERIAIYVLDNQDLIANYANELFEQRKPKIIERIFQKVREILAREPEHYEWRPDGCPYDFSGEIKEAGQITLEQTLYHFAMEEYTGDRTATYESCYGWHYNTYDEEISEVTRDIGWDIMYEAIKYHIQLKYGQLPNQEEFEIITWKAKEFDPIYDKCHAYEFFCSEGALNYLGIENVMLTEIVNSNK